MSILDLLVGKDVGPMDILESYQQGQKHKSSLETTDLNRQAKQAELDDYLGNRENARSKRENALRIQELNIEQKEKDLDKVDTKFGPMVRVKIKGKDIGAGQYGEDGKLYNFRTNKQLTKGGYKKKASRVGTPSKQQIKNAIKSVKTDDDLGQEGAWNVGFSKDNYDTIGNAIASRVRELKTQAKDLGETLNDADATSLAKEEFSAMEGTAWDKSGTGYRSKTLKKDIRFGSGISQVLLDHLGVDEEAQEAQDADDNEDIVRGPDGIKYRVLTRKEDGTPDDVELAQ